MSVNVAADVITVLVFVCVWCVGQELPGTGPAAKHTHTHIHTHTNTHTHTHIQTQTHTHIQTHT